MHYVVADNYLCLFALLEMILKEKGINISQYELAEKIGITIPNGYQSKVKNVKYSTLQNDYGAIVTTDSLREIFDKAQIDMKVSYLDVFHTNEIDLISILNQQLSENRYVIFAFSYGILYNKLSYVNLGHVSLLQEVLDDDWIKIYDPGPDNSGIKKVRISDIYEAMRRKGGMYFLI